MPAEPHKLQLSIDRKSGVSLYKQITLQIEMAIADGRMASGDQLPTVQTLAVELQVNPNTVVKAYSELELRGLVTARQGTGTFISDRAISLSEVERELVLAEITRSVAVQAGSYGFSPKEVIDSLRELIAHGGDR